MPGRSSMERKTAPANAEARRSGELDRYVAQELNQEGSKTKISPAIAGSSRLASGETARYYDVRLARQRII